MCYQQGRMILKIPKIFKCGNIVKIFEFIYSFIIYKSKLTKTAPIGMN
jgi:hypothetical protein